MDIKLIGRLTLIYHEGDINTLLMEEEATSSTALTIREKERAIKAHAMRHVNKIAEGMVLSKAIISLPIKARLIFVQHREEE